MRMSGNVDGSEQVLTHFFSTASGNMVPEDLAPLHISQAMNHAFRFRFTEARAELLKWKPTQDFGRDNLDLIWSHVATAGRVLRGQGNFKEARVCFEVCLQTDGLSQSKHCLILSALADVYCELSYAESDPSFLVRAGAMVKPKIDEVRSSRRQHLKGYRRLLLSLVEVQINQHQYSDAETDIKELLDTYEKLRSPDMVDRLGHVRALVAFARICTRPAMALQRWKDALFYNSLYNPWEEEVFTCGVVYLFLAVIWHRLGDRANSLGNLGRAVHVLQQRQPQHLIPGLGTYVYGQAWSDWNRCNQC